MTSTPDRTSPTTRTDTPSRRPSSPARWAGGVTVAYAAAYGLPSIPIAVFVFREHRLPWLWDLFPMYGGPWWDEMTDEQFVATLRAFLAVNAVVAAGGVLLWFGRRTGAVIALAPLPLEFAFWLGYALPFPPLIALLRIALVTAAWRSLHRQDSCMTSKTGDSALS